jgi:hypothetical protein
VYATSPGPKPAPRKKPAPPPKATPVALYAALGIIGLAAVGGGIGFTVHKVSEDRRAQQELAAQVQRDLEAARKKAEADAVAARFVPPPEVLPILSISSTPGAAIVAKWGEGMQKRGQSALEVPVPKGTAVHLEASLAGHETMTQDLYVASNVSVPMLLLKKKERRRVAQPDQPKPEEMPIELEDFGTPK